MTIKVSLKIEKEAGNRGDSSLFIFRPAQTSGHGNIQRASQLSWISCHQKANYSRSFLPVWLHIGRVGRRVDRVVDRPAGRGRGPSSLDNTIVFVFAATFRPQFQTAKIKKDV